MAITLPERFDDADSALDRDNMTPRQIVELLDKFIVGQAAAKRAVAIAIRNRQRRLRLPADLVDEVAPKNILMIGPTGVGKTEISRRLSKLTGSPFLKVEATKFTEVGYVGRDVESMIRDLVDISMDLVRQEHAARVGAKAQTHAEEHLLDLLLPPIPPAAPGTPSSQTPEEREEEARSRRATREKLRSQLHAGKLDERSVEVDVDDSAAPSFQVFTGQGADTMDVNMKDMLPGMFGGGRKKRRRMTVAEAREHLAREAATTLIDEDEVQREGIHRAEASGIVFLDEIDKVAGRQGAQGPDVSREGVQRDILPIVEGTVVKTRNGMVRTDHILFLAAGAFHVSKPSDLIPELQGRFPLRVELEALTREDLFRILTEPENSLVRQYTALMATEDVTLTFSEEAIQALAELAATVNERTENIGARRLHTMMEKVLESLSFEAPERGGDSIVIDEEYVRETLSELVADQDLSKYIL